MKFSVLVGWASGLMVMLAGASSEAFTLRCEGRLVSVGDTVLELKARCGAPDHVESRPVLQAAGFVGIAGQANLRYSREVVELWTYAARDGQLPRLVTVRRGRVEAAQSLGRVDIVKDDGCRRVLAGSRARLGAIALSCGAPDDRAVWEEERLLRRADGLEVRRLVVHERWTYDPGPGRLLRILHFRNGRLVRVESGGRSPS